MIFRHSDLNASPLLFTTSCRFFQLRLPSGNQTRQWKNRHCRMLFPSKLREFPIATFENTRGYRKHQKSEYINSIPKSCGGLIYTYLKM